MPIQYVSIRYGGKGRAYVYSVDHADPVSPGAQVEVTLPSGATRVDTVESVSPIRPSYATKVAKLI